MVYFFFNYFCRLSVRANDRYILGISNYTLANVTGWHNHLKSSNSSFYWKSFCSESKFTIMTENNVDDVFVGVPDRYNGMIINSEKNPCSDASVFSVKLQNSLDKWKCEGVRGVWFNFSLDYAFWVPILAKSGFVFHHAEDKQVSMTRWLPENEESGIPNYAHTMTGVGGLVVNDRQEILVISERYKLLNTSHWKLPGGYIEKGETIADAATREVFEETGVKTKFESLVAFRHSQGMAYGCSDTYFIVELTPLPDGTEIKKCDREIEAAQWMKIQEYINHPNVLDNNKMIAKKYLAYKKAGLRIKGEKTFHQLLKRQQTIFTIDVDEEI